MKVLAQNVTKITCLWFDHYAVKKGWRMDCFLPFSRVACVACDKNGQTLICIYSEWSHASRIAISDCIMHTTHEVCLSKLRKNTPERMKRMTQILIIFPSKLMARKTMDRPLDHYHFGTKLSLIKGKDMLIIQKIEMLTIIISFRKQSLHHLGEKHKKSSQPIKILPFQSNRSTKHKSAGGGRFLEPRDINHNINPKKPPNGLL